MISGGQVGQIGHSKLPGQILGGYDVGEVGLRPLMAAVTGVVDRRFAMDF